MRNCPARARAKVDLLDVPKGSAAERWRDGADYTYMPTPTVSNQNWKNYKVEERFEIISDRYRLRHNVSVLDSSNNGATFQILDNIPGVPK